MEDMPKIVLLFDLRNVGPKWVTFKERSEERDPLLGVTSIPASAFVLLGEPDELSITLEKVL